MSEPMHDRVAVISGGPAGLMAAEAMAGAGLAVTVYDHMPSFGRKLLMAGRGGLNLTHAESLPALLDRYRPAAPALLAAIEAFPPEALIAWCEGLEVPTFVGSSLRVFPRAMKASPLLRAWLRRLEALGVAFAPRRRWVGFDAEGGLCFADGTRVRAAATVLACGGASWPRLGSDGLWTQALPEVAIAKLRPANCGFEVAWSEPFRARFAGVPLKRIAVAVAEGDSEAASWVRGEAMVTRDGIEGGAIYAVAGRLRDTLEADTGTSGDAAARLWVDVRPDLEAARLRQALAGRSRGESLATVLRKAVGLAPVAIGLVQEALHDGTAQEGAGRDDLAGLIKRVPVRVTRAAPIARAISTAGGIALAALDAGFRLRAYPMVFAAGEMLDWEAPTGGYLLQAAFATGRAAGLAAAAALGKGGEGADQGRNHHID